MSRLFLSTGVHPRRRKTALVSLHKGEDRRTQTITDQYQNCLCSAKILESLINSQLEEFLTVTFLITAVYQKPRELGEEMENQETLNVFINLFLLFIVVTLYFDNPSVDTLQVVSRYSVTCQQCVS